MMAEVMKEKKIWTLRPDEFYGRWKNGGLVERIRWLNVRMDNGAGKFGIHVMDESTCFAKKQLQQQIHDFDLEKPSLWRCGKIICLHPIIPFQYFNYAFMLRSMERYSLHVNFVALAPMAF